MNDRSKIILTANNMKDVENISASIKYINLNLDDPDRKVLDYFINNGQRFSYSDSNGYIYVDYKTFYTGQSIIDKIVSDIPKGFNDIEKSKYLYVILGSILSYDINVIPEKNELFNFYHVNIINNVWGSIVGNKTLNGSLCKLYSYICKLTNISNEVITTNDYGYFCNKLNINNSSMIVDLTRDLPFIQGKFQTRCFGAYNEDFELDKKIGYVKKNYSDKEIDKILKNLDYTKSDFLKDLLLKTNSVLPVANINPIELGIIYDYIFSKYCPNYDICINNLYINDIYHEKEHFILITYGDEHYSFNFKKNCFVLVEDEDLIKNLQSKKIGIYANEQIPHLNMSADKVLN